MNARRILYSILALLFVSMSGVQASTVDDVKLLVEKKFSVSPNENLTVELVSGDTKIRSWNGSEVSVKIYGNEIAEERITFIVEKTSDGVRVKSEYEKDYEYNNPIVKVEIMVPRSFNASVSTASGDLDLESLDGEIKFETASGDLKLKDANGTLLTTTASGDIYVSDYKGKAKIETASGDVKLQDFVEGIKVATASGDVEISGSNGGVHVSTASGEITVDYEGANEGMDLNTVSGDIVLRLPSDLKAVVKFSTVSGNLDNDFGNAKLEKMSKSNVTLKLNGGGKEINCNSVSGDVKLIAK